ncbi:potassium transporter [Malaciobacter molluscorum LMG 25693]|uniref:Potassium transporter n=1 Tax=Malaciobacter molluscorum LMG 25693 TaxID=870501 RepID=A0A2G1DL36_9BACT|nr:TrkH family potassium uptake protein [Malaciobacter molluscorum]AXX92000.1 potassium transporter KtrAB, KtrB subunit [Malaciobacter molluscorum LMG 25693]PHO19233.1 potassium transporter [Malaciobacter molluscorum LMG 25693]RXJ96503.1 potassium transporter [Malaciobacter molluscorum]
MGYKYVRNIFLGYVIIIVFGGLFLSLPICHKGELSFIDAIFTSASATCVTGLIVTSTSDNFTLLGEISILILIQCGGIGYMTLVVIFYIFIRNRLTINEKRAMKESLDLPDLHVSSFVKKIILIVLIIELIGAIFLSFGFYEKYPLLDSIWYGIFHSISAFNNAGFSLFPNSLMDFQNNTLVLTIISFLVIFGGLGYFVLIEIYENRKISKRFSIHTRIMIYGTIFLIIFGMILFLSIEWNNKNTFGNMTFYQKLLNSFFLSINFRTSGFNSIDISSLKDSSLFFSSLFMMIGGGQGSTAGGMKITTVAILIITVIYILKESNQQPNIFKRTIDQKLINKALAIIMCSSFFVLLSALILIETQKLPLLKTLFEVVSAFGTVGVSTGNGGILSFSQQFDTFGKAVIIILMLAGRLGVFAFGLALIGKAKTKHFKYPTGRIII